MGSTIYKGSRGEGYRVGSVSDGGTVYKEHSEVEPYRVGSVSDGGTIYKEHSGVGPYQVGYVDASGKIYKGSHQVGYVDASGNVYRGSRDSEFSRQVAYAYGVSNLAYLGGALLLSGLLEDEFPPLRCPNCGSSFVPQWLEGMPRDYLRCDRCGCIFPWLHGLRRR